MTGIAQSSRLKAKNAPFLQGSKPRTLSLVSKKKWLKYRKITSRNNVPAFTTFAVSSNSVVKYSATARRPKLSCIVCYDIPRALNNKPRATLQKRSQLSRESHPTWRQVANHLLHKLYCIHKWHGLLIVRADSCQCWSTIRLWSYSPCHFAATIAIARKTPILRFHERLRYFIFQKKKHFQISLLLSSVAWCEKLRRSLPMPSSDNIDSGFVSELLDFFAAEEESSSKGLFPNIFVWFSSGCRLGRLEVRVRGSWNDTAVATTKKRRSPQLLAKDWRNFGEKKRQKAKYAPRSSLNNPVLSLIRN